MGIIKDKKIINKIESALAEIRPFLEDDGGDINFVELTEDWVVKVRLVGACSSCSISMMTLKNGVEVVIKNAVPQVKSVIEISEV
jgi:Fe-S cluster biogenesis protein NfuA